MNMAGEQIHTRADIEDTQRVERAIWEAQKAPQRDNVNGEGLEDGSDD